MNSTIQTSSVVIRVKVNRQLKADAEAILKPLGLTISDALELMLKEVVSQKKLPFKISITNHKTRAAMREARAGNLKRANTVEELLAELKS